jgi:outer membrane protein OmpU
MKTEGKLMKKVLFATTALVAGALATPQVASAQSVSAGNADISFGGYARWGLAYDDSAAPGTSETNITSRWRFQIDATAESDAGVLFGARTRIQINDGATGGTTNAARFFIRSGGLEVGVGNTNGALEFMPGQYPIDLGLTGLGYDYTAYAFNGDAYSSGGQGAAGRNGVEVTYRAGDFGVHLSASEGAGDRIALVGDYTFSGWTVALGFQDSSTATDTEWTISAGGDIGPANVTLAYADNGTNGDHWVLAGRFDVGASTNVEAYFADADAFADDNSYGVDFNHNMGGGTSLRGGIAKLGAGNTVADFGVRFNF